MDKVITPDGKTRLVKNLAWLVRHARQVRMIEVSPQHHFQDPQKGWESRMIATLDDGTKFIANWACTSLCREWIKARRYIPKSAIVKFYTDKFKPTI